MAQTGRGRKLSRRQSECSSLAWNIQYLRNLNLDKICQRIRRVLVRIGVVVDGVLKLVGVRDDVVDVGLLTQARVFIKTLRVFTFGFCAFWALYQGNRIWATEKPNGFRKDLKKGAITLRTSGRVHIRKIVWIRSHRKTKNTFKEVGKDSKLDR